MTSTWLESEPGILVELAINKAIERDPLAQRKLSQLAGRSLLLRLTFPKLVVGVILGGEGVSLVSEGTLEQPDCEVEGAPSDLLALLLDPQQAFENRVQLKGNTQLATQLREIAQQLDLDWGGLLGDCIGDPAAQLLINLFNKGRAAASEASNNLLDDLDNWLHEEIQVQPCGAELDGYYDQIDQLRLDSDRLKARIERVESDVQSATEVSSSSS
ncbi:MAG: SCP2 sterol-binding domain-containing protein [Halopseudomonas sp.]